MQCLNSYKTVKAALHVSFHNFTAFCGSAEREEGWRLSCWKKQDKETTGRLTSECKINCKTASDDFLFPIIMLISKDYINIKVFSSAEGSFNSNLRQLLPLETRF